jgi:hypothetical protein
VGPDEPPARATRRIQRSLADVRRLLVPSVQFNLAERQVNIASAGRTNVKV